MGKISELPDGGTVLTTDELMVVRNGGNVKAKLKAMATQDKAAVDVTGGIVDATLGSRTPAQATVTDLVATGSVNMRAGQSITFSDSDGVSNLNPVLQKFTDSQVYLDSYGGDVRIRTKNGPGVANSVTLESETQNALLYGNLRFINPGSGIDFSSTADVVGMTSELLDDYEEGFWTVALSFASGTGTIIYVLQIGRYTKIGNLVTFWGDVQTSSIAARTGPLSITGLPYLSGAAGFGASHASFGALSVGVGGNVSPLVNPSSTQMQAYHWSSPTGTNILTHTEWTDTGRLIFGGSYYV